MTNTMPSPPWVLRSLLKKGTGTSQKRPLSSVTGRQLGASPLFQRTVRQLLWAVLIAFMARPAQAQWPQWGGRDRNFEVDTSGLASAWPADGPTRLWSRPLGDGCSTIVVDDGVLYTMYRAGDEEFTVALDAGTGKTLWQHSWRERFTPGRDDFSNGPYATPLVAGTRVYTVGVGATMHCFDKKTGKVLWQHDLMKKFDGKPRMFGYACSPLAYRQTVILPVDRPWGRGGEADGHGQAVVALDQATGEVVWQSADLRIDGIEYSSPILIDVEGQTQLVFRIWTDLLGIDPNNGKRLWRQGGMTHGETYLTPLWLGDNQLLCSRYSGSHLIRLTQREGRTVPKQVWHSGGFRAQYGNAVSLGDCVYGSTGNEPALLTCMDVKTGKTLWRHRGFGVANCLAADGKLIVLDENGLLMLATATRDGFVVHAQHQLLQRHAWAAPTLVGRTLYLRDRRTIMAVDLG